MEDDVGQRFDEVDRRFTAAEKRFDELKWYFGGVAGFFTIWFAVLTVVLSWNYSDQRESLRDFQKNLREDLGKAEGTPQLDLLGTNGQPLAGQDIVATFFEEDHTLEIVVNHFIRNTGTAPTGPMTVKVYTPAQIELDTRSTDEAGFKYETVITPKDLDPSELPGGLSTEWYHRVGLKRPVRPAPGRYPSLVKIYYGKGRMAQASFTLVVPVVP